MEGRIPSRDCQVLAKEKLEKISKGGSKENF
jgi:hypothetical protein